MKTSIFKLATLTLAFAAVVSANASGYGQPLTAQIQSIPEPPTIVVGALLLLPLGASALRILRRSDAKNSSRP